MLNHDDDDDGDDAEDKKPISMLDENVRSMHDVAIAGADCEGVLRSEVKAKHVHKRTGEICRMYLDKT